MQKLFKEKDKDEFLTKRKITVEKNKKEYVVLENDRTQKVLILLQVGVKNSIENRIIFPYNSSINRYYIADNIEMYACIAGDNIFIEKNIENIYYYKMPKNCNEDTVNKLIDESKIDPYTTSTNHFTKITLE